MPHFWLHNTCVHLSCNIQDLPDNLSCRLSNCAANGMSAVVMEAPRTKRKRDILYFTFTSASAHCVKGLHCLHCGFHLRRASVSIK